MSVLLSLLRRLPRERFRVTVCCRAGGRAEAGLRRVGGIEVVPLPYGERSSSGGGLTRRVDLAALPFAAACLARLVWTVVTRRIDVIHACDEPRALSAAWLLSLVSRRPLVVHVHAPCVPSRGSRLALARAVRIVACSEAMKADFVRCLGRSMQRIEVLHDGVDVERAIDGDDLRAELDIPPDAVVVGMASQLAPEKGQADLVEAARDVLQRAPDTWFVLAGEDAAGVAGYRGHLEARALRLGVAERILFVGFRDDMDAFYRTLDVVVDAAWQEPLGLTALEAMVFGRPVVGTAAGGIPEIVEHGVHGLLVPPRRPDELAAAIVRLARDRALRERLGRHAARDVRARFDAACQVERLGALLEAAAR
ncbi:MAG: glycosyltransferase family 4 protein [Planctomycetes bacterium]|nr:glycosyltransferase family 4 protein [Planctomycetota bacterium]